MIFIFKALFGLLVLIWMLLGVCVAAIGIHTVIIWLDLSYKTLVYSFAALTVFVLLLDLVLRLITLISS